MEKGGARRYVIADNAEDELSEVITRFTRLEFISYKISILFRPFFA